MKFSQIQYCVGTSGMPDQTEMTNWMLFLIIAVPFLFGYISGVLDERRKHNDREAIRQSLFTIAQQLQNADNHLREMNETWCSISNQFQHFLKFGHK